MREGSEVGAVSRTVAIGPRVGACVVTFNRLAQLESAVNRLLDEGVDRVTVVDNGSTDGTRAWLASLDDDRLEVIESAVNLGGAGGFELGMRHIVAAGDIDWILLQDDDAWPVPGALDTFRRHAAQATPDIGGLAAAVYTPSGDICEINRPGLNPFGALTDMVRAVVRGRAALHVDDAAYHRASTDVDCASFVGFFVRAELVRSRVGLPRGEFFIYSDDQLYSLSIRRAGYRVVFLPSVEYCHDTASKSDAGYFSPVWKVYFLYRNNIEFYRAMAGRWFWPVMAFKLPTWLLRARHYPDRRAYWRMLRLGVRDGIGRNFGRSFAEVQARADDATAPRPAGSARR